MTPLPWILVAVPREHGEFRRRLRIVETLRRSPTSIWRCQAEGRDFLLVETGVGGDMVRSTLDWLRERSTPTRVVMAGFAGALSHELNVGDGVWAESVVDPEGARIAATWRSSGPGRHGVLLTSDRLVATPAEKDRLAALHGAMTVDMETSHVAAWCQQQGTPWGCVRVVSDDAKTPVATDVFGLLEGGRVSAWALAKAIVRRPSIVRELIHLGRSTKIASATIGAALMQALRFDSVPHPL